MSEIGGFLSSPGWWFSTILVAICVNVASNFLFEKLKSVSWKASMPGAPNENTMLGIIVTYATLTLFAAVVTGLAYTGEIKLMLFPIFLGIFMFKFMLQYMPRWPVPWVWTTLILQAAFLTLYSMMVGQQYSTYTTPFVTFFVSSSSAFNLMLGSWHFSNLRKMLAPTKKQETKRR
jgi:hypothetical protein